MATLWNRWMGLLLAVLGNAGPAWAAPADDHQAGALAYSRGDVVAAMSLLRGPAKVGHAPSQVLLAFILDRADFAEESFVLYRDAAAQNDAEGLAGVASAYQSGRGIAKDEKLALQHFSKAADLGHPKSIEILAEAHLKGQLGLANVDPAQVVAALRRAADKGHLPSVDALTEAYQAGRWGLAPDPQQATVWKTRGVELRAQRAGPTPARKGSR